jgi:hypothetical protein
MAKKIDKSKFTWETNQKGVRPVIIQKQGKDEVSPADSRESRQKEK